MINETVLLLTYYYGYEDRNHSVLKYIIKDYCPGYLPFDVYLYQPLRSIFSKVIIYDYLKRRAEIGLKAMNEEIIALVEKERPKYVLWTSFSDDVRQSTLEAIRNTGAGTVGWFFDDEWRFNSYSKYWAPYLDYCVTNSIEIEPKYAEMGARVVQTIPNTGIAVNRDWSAEEKYEISFVGTMKFAGRRQYLEELNKRDIHVTLFGVGSGGYVSFEEMLDIFASSKINLNFSKVGSYYWVKQIKGRVFQVCMAGGFMLTEYVPGIEKYFKIGKEIDCFENADEMVEKIEYYLKHNEERKAIARAGWEKATREYTSQRMTEKVFDEIEKKKAIKNGQGFGHVQKPQMPIWIRSFPAQYHLDWARALLKAGEKEEFWKEALKLSRQYYPLNLWTCYYSVVGIFPPSARSVMFKPYESAQKLRIAILRRLQSISLLRRMADGFLRKLW